MLGSTLRRLMAGILAGAAVVMAATTAFAFTTPRLKPQAPGPAYLSTADHAILLDIADLLKKRRFSEAYGESAGLSNPIAKSLGQWLYFMAEDPEVRLSDADAFLDGHVDWPAMHRIQAFVEGRISRNAPADDILAFFDGRDPVTGDGKIHLARALFARGEKESGEAQLRDAWINNNFTVSKERAILSSYGGRLTKEDHAARVDRLLWARQVTNARRVFSRLDRNEREKAKVRAALLLRASSATAMYSKLSRDDQLDSGVLLAAVRYYRRTGNETQAISLAGQSPKDPETLRNSERWWYERHLLMRWALKEGHFADAYAATANHGLEPGGAFADAEFNAGWIALRFLNEPERAETHFLALASSVGTPISLSRAFYWLGRTAEASGNDDLSTAYYQSAAKHYYSYYGQLAAEELGGPALEQRFSPPVVPNAAERALFGSRPAVAALRMLSDLNLDYEFMVFAYHVDGILDHPGEYLELASLTNGEGAPHLTVRAGKVAIQRDAFTPEVAYPLVFVPEEAKRFVEPEIILGLSRQESEFNPRAYSRAGARGMMQLLPSTAQITAQKAGLRYSRSALLDDPVYNMTIGSAHLSHLLDRFDGSLILTLGAYNAGAVRAEQWIETYGDPRGDSTDPVDWVELIPFGETRNYVQRVLENIQVYRGRLNNTPIPGRLSADLERGGARNRVARYGNLPSQTLFAASPHHAGGQNLAPLPDATAARAAQYRITRALEETMERPETTNAAANAAMAPSVEDLAPRAPDAPLDNTAAPLPSPPPHANVSTSASPPTTEDVAKEQAPPTYVNETAAPALGDIKVSTQWNSEGEAINVLNLNTEVAPQLSVRKPSPPPLTILEPSDAPAPLQERPAPVAIEDLIANIYASPPDASENAIADPNASLAAPEQD